MQSYRDLLASIDTWFDTARDRALPVIVPCTRGCASCCHGPFDISPADAKLVSEAIVALPDRLRLEVQLRATANRELMSRELPQWQAPWDINGIDEEEFDAACDALQSLPCPALDIDGACLIHASRPATCRMTGLGLITVDGNRLENVCPIQEQFPEYQKLTPFPFDLAQFEAAAEAWDEVAQNEGFVATTIAGAAA